MTPQRPGAVTAAIWVLAGLIVTSGVTALLTLVFADDLDGLRPPSPYARLFYHDLAQARASSARAARLGRALGARIFTSHDPGVFAAMRQLPEAYGDALPTRGVHRDAQPSPTAA